MGYPLGYGPLVQAVLRKRLQKGETLTDWRRRPLSQEQIRYAFDDVRDLLAIWKRIDGTLTRLGRSSWATEEFASFVRRALQESCEVERWRNSRGRATSMAVDSHLSARFTDGAKKLPFSAIAQHARSSAMTW